MYVMARNGNTELGGSIEELLNGPETCPACGQVLRDDHLEEDGRSLMHGEDNKIRGKDSHKIAQKRLVCTEVAGHQILVETEDGVEEMTSDYRLEQGFDE